MRLADAAKSFDQMECLDAYTGKFAFKAQLGLYDDTKRDSEAGERRVISTAPDVVLPKRRVVSTVAGRFIIGHPNTDTYRGAAVRVGWVAHEATDFIRAVTLGQACRGETGLRLWAGSAWVKNVADNMQSSDLTPQVNMHVAQDEPVDEGHVLITKSGVAIVRNARHGPAGTRIMLSDLLPLSAITMAVLRVETVDPVTEVRSGSDVSLRVLRARWQSLFSYRHQAAPKFGADDVQIAIAKVAATAAVGQLLTMDTGVWQLNSVLDEGDVWLCRGVRRA